MGVAVREYSPKSEPDVVRDDIYECGLRTEGPSLVQFNFRFYYIALLFVLLDVENRLPLPLGTRLR